MIYYVIPARKNSKGLPFKNRILFRLTARSLDPVLPGSVLVTSDDDFILNNADRYNFTYIRRDDELSNDTASMKDVLIDLSERCGLPQYDTLVLLYLTYPERTYTDIRDVLRFYTANNGKSLLCRKQPETSPYLCLHPDGLHGKQVIKHDLYRRQDYPEIFELSHFVAICQVGELRFLNPNLYNDETIFYPIKQVVDVDERKDLEGYLDTKAG